MPLAVAPGMATGWTIRRSFGFWLSTNFLYLLTSAIAFLRSASSRFCAEDSSAIFLLLAKISAVFFSDSSRALAVFALYSSMRV